MLKPTVHENLQKNILVVGATILALLKKRSYNIENLYQEIRKDDINVERYYDTLTFLWTANLIKVEEFYLHIQKKI